jgi:hypothetical protein
MSGDPQRLARNRYERALIVLMRLSGILLMTAIVPAVMPFEWMQVIHRWLGLGELPRLPIIGYLTRSLSAMYAMHGAVTYFVSLDIRRFRPVVQLLAALAIVFGVFMVLMDWYVQMPLYWLLSEGPFVMLLGGLFLWLAGHVLDVAPDQAPSRSQESSQPVMQKK